MPRLMIVTDVLDFAKPPLACFSGFMIPPSDNGITTYISFGSARNL